MKGILIFPLICFSNLQMLEMLLDLVSISFILFPSIGLFLFLIYQKGNSAADDKNDDSFEDKKNMLYELFGIVLSFRSHLNKLFLECVLVGEVPKNWSDNSLFALFGAALNGQIETLKILSEDNDVNLRMGQLKTAGGTIDGVSLLWIASAAGHFEIVKFLYQKGDDVNGNGSVTFGDHKIINGISPLCAASCAGHLKVCEFLVENNANINHRMDIGFTPLDCAYIGRHFEIAKFLRENGAKATIEKQFQFCTEGTLAVPPLISGTVN